MYTYLENLDEVKTRYNFPYNVIGKIKDIQLCKDNSIPFYRFTLYNDNTDKELLCVIKESLFDKTTVEEFDSIVIEYAHIKNFMGKDECLLIRKISKPVCGLTGNKNEDILRLMEKTKQLIESEYKDGALVYSYHHHLNRAYLKFRKYYLDSRKR